MKNSLRFLAALALAFSLQSVAKADGLQFAAASKVKKHTQAETSPVNATVFEDSKMWVRLYGGYDFSALGDIVNGTNQFVKYALANGYTSSGSGSNSGFQAGLLWGFRLNKSNSLALDFGNVFTSSSDLAGSKPGVTFAGHNGPNLLSVSLDYFLDFVKGPGSRTFLTLGAGYYHGSVTASLVSPASNYNGVFTGDTVGGTLALGEELSLGGSFGLNFSVRGRLVSFGKISSTTAAVSVPYVGVGPPPYSLAITGLTGYYALIALPNSIIDASGGTSRYAALDYTGVDANIGFDIYF